MARPGIEPWSPGPLAKSIEIYIYIKIYIYTFTLDLYLFILSAMLGDIKIIFESLV